MRKIIFAAAMLSAAAIFALGQQGGALAQQEGGPPAAGRGAPGGGRGAVTPNPNIRLPPFAPSTAATTFASTCAGCHGTNLEGTPRARSLFTASFLDNRSDEEIVHSIKTGFP